MSGALEIVKLGTLALFPVWLVLGIIIDTVTWLSFLSPGYRQARSFQKGILLFKKLQVSCAFTNAL